MNRIPVTVIILTYNEALNIADCINSVSQWAEDVIIVDSYSTDDTQKIALQFNCKFIQNKWVSFAKQREWAIKNTSIDTEWIFFVDADERPTEKLKNEIGSFISSNPRQDGCYIRRRFIFLEKWMKYGGYYPLSELRLMRKDKVSFYDEGGGARERFLVEGEICELKADMLHIYQKSIKEWIDKHSRLAELEANSIREGKNQVLSNKLGKKVWIRNNVWDKLPHGIRPLLLFFYRYVICLGFLNGIRGFYYCVLHDLWYPLLIDLYLLEISTKNNKFDY